MKRTTKRILSKIIALVLALTLMLPDLVPENSNASVDGSSITIYSTGSYISTGAGSYSGSEWQWFSDSSSVGTGTLNLTNHSYFIAEDGSGNKTVAYCMQSFMKAPTTSGATYTKGHSNLDSTWGSTIAGYKVDAAIGVAKFLYGGTNADPNSDLYGGSWNGNDGGTYGTYITTSGVVRGLMIGGKVYPMTADEARTLTALVVHSVVDHTSVTSLTGTSGRDLMPAYNHLMGIANGTYEQVENGWNSLSSMDSKDYYKPSQSFTWQIYNPSTSNWESYTDTNELSQDYVGGDGNVKLRVNYSSYNMCNNFTGDDSSGNKTVAYDYSAFTIGNESHYYNYFDVNENTGNNVPFTVTYSKVSSRQEQITDYWYDGTYTYNRDVFEQTATITIKAEDLKDDSDFLSLSTSTETGVSGGKIYTSENGGMWAAQMYESSAAQDMLFLASTNTLSANSTMSLALEDSTGWAKVKKSTDSRYTNCVNGNSMYSLKGAEFKIYTDINCTTLATNDVLITDVNGDTNTVELDAGVYWIKETKAPLGYQLNTDSHRCVVVENQTTTTTISDTPIGDPIRIETIGKLDINENGEEIKGALPDTEFTVKYFDGVGLSDSQIKSSTPLKTWVFKTDSNGQIDIENDNPISGNSMYIDANGSRFFPAGSYVIYESKSPEGYERNGQVVLKDASGGVVSNQAFDEDDYILTEVTFVTENGNTKVVETVKYAGVTLNISEGTELWYKDNPTLVGFSVKKLDYDTGSSNPQGNATNLKATFELINNNNRQDGVWVDSNQDGKKTDSEIFAYGSVVYTFTTKDDGSYTSYNKLIQSGSYIIREKTGGAPVGYLEDGVMSVTLDTSAYNPGDTVPSTGNIQNKVIRGGVRIQKIDSTKPESQTKVQGDYAATIPQGDATFNNAQYEIINRSTNYVTVDTNGDGNATEVYQPGERICILTVDNTKKAATSNTFLPYGTYEIKEISAPTGYKLTNKANGSGETFSITSNGQMASYEFNINNPLNAMEEDIIRGGFEIYKEDSDTSNNNAQGNANLRATFTVTNDSANYVWVDTNQDGTYTDNECYLPGEVVFTFITDADTGYYKSPDKLLPYGTYTIKETVPPEGYLMSSSTTPTLSSTFSVRTEGSYPIARSIENDVVRGGFEFDKSDEETEETNAQGDANLQGTYNVINKSDDYVIVDSNNDGVRDEINENYAPNEVVYTFKTNADTGYFKSADDLLPYGDYEIVEVQAPEGYLLLSNKHSELNFVFDITTEDEIVDATGTVKNLVIRGGFEFTKLDEDTMGNEAQGNADLQGTYNVINKSADYVIVDTNADGTRDIINERYAPNEVVFTFKTDAETGYYKSVDDLLPYGTYEIKEIGAPTGYLLSSTNNSDMSITFTVEVEDSINESDDDISNLVKRGGFEFTKKDEDTKTAEAQGDCNLAATYNVINRSDSFVVVDTNEDGTYDLDTEKYEPGEIVFTFTTNADTGYYKSADDLLPYGDYEIVEIEAPEGYLMTSNINPNLNVTFDVTEEDSIYDANDDVYNLVKRGGFEFTKNDEETKTNVPLGSANLQGTYNVINKSKYHVIVDSNEDGIKDEINERFEPGDVVFTFTTDSDTGYYKSVNDLLPYGTYEIVEINPPTGYLMLSDKNENLSVTFTVREHGSMYDGNNDIYNYVVRNDIHFVKRNQSSGNTMAYIPFKITALDKDNNEIESHIIYTDINGYYSSSNDFVNHTINTNAGDQIYADYIAYYEETGEWKDLIDVSEYANAGTWFGVGTTPTDNLRLKVTGALPYGKYKIEELPCERNEGFKLYKDVFTVTGDANDTTIEIDPHRYQYGIPSGEINYGTIYNNDMPELDTEALVEDSHVTIASDYVVIVDKIMYYNLQKDTTYKLVTTLYDTETLLPITDVDGNIIKKEKELKTSSKSGATSVELEVDATGYEGKTIVVYEELYDVDGNFIVGHTDITDEDQSIKFPGITTELTDTNGNDMVKAQKDVVLRDRITYKNLNVGSSYKIKGYLIDKSTNKYALDDHGNKIYAEKVFKVTETNGYVDVEYKFDATTLGGKDLVAFEELYRGTEVIAYHMEIDDELQTIHFPIIGTSAIDKDSNTKFSYGGDEVTIVDTVDYANLNVGEEYTITGVLMIKNDDGSEQELLDNDGNVITSSNTFVANEKNGSTLVEFTFDGNIILGKTVVAYEDLYWNSINLATHADINDEAQTMYSPKIGTSAINSDNKTHYAEGVGKITIVDTVTYEDVIPGETYIVKGILMNKGTNLPLSLATSSDANADKENNIDKENKYITLSVEFTPEKANGLVEVQFTFDASQYKGQTVVVFEELYLKDKESLENEEDTEDETISEILIADHKDISDEGQTIYITNIGTTATDENTTINVAANGSTVIVDKVFYEGLVPGQEYIISGKLMEKVVDAEGNVTAKPFTTDDTKDVSEIETLINGVLGKSNEYISEIRFTPEKSSGYVDIKFNIDTNKLGGRNIVVYEKLYFENTVIATHEDINDENQTVHIPSIGTTATDKVSGSKYLSYGKEVVITDKVTYKNLVPGKEYKLVGTLMDKATGKPITGTVILATSTDANGNPASSAALQEITATTTFTPEKADGEVVVEFKVNATELKGKTLVVYEKLYYGEAVIAVHEDIKDEAQTIYVPEIGTVATVDGEHQAKRSTNTTLIDKVEYKNLEKGKKYTVVGTLMDKETGKVIEINGKPITSTVTFTPEKTSDTVEVKFTFDSTKCTRVVVFEEAYIGEGETKTLIAEHKDINDTNQTIEFSDDKKDTTEVKTGENNLLMILLGVLATIMCSVTFFFVRKRKVKRI